MTLAEKLFAAYNAHTNLLDSLYDELESIFGEDSYEDITYDWYDHSLEMIGCIKEFEPNKEQLEKVYSLGFNRLWICSGASDKKYNDDSYWEKYYFKDE